MAKAKKYSAPYIIGFHFGSDMRDISEGRYQPTRYASPAVYVVGNDYYCAPSGSQKPPARDGWNWQPLATYYGRTIYTAKA